MRRLVNSFVGSCSVSNLPWEGQGKPAKHFLPVGRAKRKTLNYLAVSLYHNWPKVISRFSNKPRHYKAAMKKEQFSGEAFFQKSVSLYSNLKLVNYLAISYYDSSNYDSGSYVNNLGLGRMKTG